MIRFTVPIKPVPGSGFRFTRSGHRYSSLKVTEFQRAIGVFAAHALGDAEPMEGPLFNCVVFRIQRPLNHYVGNKREPERLRPSAPAFHTAIRRLDTDNLVKPVKDACQKLWVDDGHVALELIAKPYDHEWAIEVLVGSMDDVDALRDALAALCPSADTTDR